MAQDPSEYWRELESYSLSDPKLEHENERDNSKFSDEGQGEAETTEQETLDSDSNDDVPRWCREEIRLLKTKAGTSGAATRKRKSPASAQELPPPLLQKAIGGSLTLVFMISTTRMIFEK